MTTIVTKNGSGAPLASDLVQGELAVDLTNKRLYTEDSGGSVIELGSNPTSLTTGTFTSTGIDDNAASTAITIDSSQDVTFTSDVKFPDNGKALFGADSDLQIYHNGSNSVVRETGAGSLYLGSDNQIVMYDTSNSEELAVFNRDGNVQLNYNNATKLATTSTGIDVTGTLTSTGTVYGNYNTGDLTGPAFYAQPNATNFGDRFGILRSRSKTGGNILQINAAGGDLEFGTGDALDTSPAFTLSTSPANAMRLDSSGNLGIGTTSPLYKLHVEDSATTRIQSKSTGTTTYGSLEARNNLNNSVNIVARGSATTGTSFSNPLANMMQVYSVNAPMTVGTFNADALILGTNNTERMRIDASGNLLVGTTSTSQAGQGIRLLSTGEIKASKSSATCMELRRNTTSGNIIDFNVAGTQSGFIAATAGGTPSFVAASDERLKDNIVDHESELTNVMALRPTRWVWKDEARGSGEGFIAQELEQTAWADLVSEGDDGFKQVSGLGVVETRLIKALQEAVTRIETLEAEVAALKGA